MLSTQSVALYKTCKPKPRLSMHICVTRPQWVKTEKDNELPIPGRFSNQIGILNIQSTRGMLRFGVIFSKSLIYGGCFTTKLLGGILVSLRPSVCLSVHPSVRLSRLPCPLCNIYSSGWILSILATNDHYHERVCRTQWPLTLTYIFKVIRPWLRKSCPLCSVYSSGWIFFIFGTNDHYN